jgi:hypothetical protein
LATKVRSAGFGDVALQRVDRRHERGAGMREARALGDLEEEAAVIRARGDVPAHRHREAALRAQARDVLRLGPRGHGVVAADRVERARHERRARQALVLDEARRIDRGRQPQRIRRPGEHAHQRAGGGRVLQRGRRRAMPGPLHFRVEVRDDQRRARRGLRRRHAGPRSFVERAKR